MNTTIHVTTTTAIKTNAQKVAEEFGITLNDLINIYLKQVSQTKKISLLEEEPSDYLIAAIKQARKDRKAGKASPVFDTAEEAIKWLAI